VAANPLRVISPPLGLAAAQGGPPALQSPDRGQLPVAEVLHDGGGDGEEVGKASVTVQAEFVQQQREQRQGDGVAERGEHEQDREAWGDDAVREAHDDDEQAEGFQQGAMSSNRT